MSTILVVTGQYLVNMLWCFTPPQDAFKGIEDEEDEDVEISQMLENYKKKGGKVLGTGK